MHSESPSDRTPGGASERLCRLLAGVDAGMAGGILAVVWLVVHSLLRREFWWAKFNVVGALFYGDAVYSMGAGRATAAGVALLLVMFGALGALFGMAARTRGVSRNLLFGVVFALAWHYLADLFVWRRIDPFATRYLPPLATLPANLVYGISLSRFASRFRSIALTFGDTGWVREFLAQENAPDLVQAPEETFDGAGAVAGAAPGDNSRDGSVRTEEGEARPEAGAASPDEGLGHCPEEKDGPDC